MSQIRQWEVMVRLVGPAGETIAFTKRLVIEKTRSYPDIAVEQVIAGEAKSAYRATIRAIGEEPR